MITRLKLDEVTGLLESGIVRTISTPTFMHYPNTTQLPNMVTDALLPSLTLGELKVLLVVVRQTFGWVDRRTGRRKERDRITHFQFVQKTGLSKRVISTALSSLLAKGCIVATDSRGNSLAFGHKRKGRSYIYYSFQPEPSSAQNVPKPAQKSGYNKTNPSKTEMTKMTTFTEAGRLCQNRLHSLIGRQAEGNGSR